MFAIVESLFIKVIGAGLGFVISLFITRYFDKATAGEMFVFLSTISIFVVFSKLGLESVITRRVASIEGQVDLLGGLFDELLLLICKSCILISCIILVMGSLIGELFFLEATKIAICSLVATVVLDTFLSCLARFIQGNHRPKLFLVILVSQKFFLFIIILVLVLKNTFTVNGFYLSVAISYIPSIIVLHLSLRKIFEGLYSRKKADILNSQLVKEAKPLLVVSILTVFSQHISVFIISSFVDQESVANYAVCLRIVSLVGFLLIAANTVIASKISLEYKQLGTIAAYNLYKSFVWRLVLLCIPVFVLLLSCGTQILKLFGEGYDAAYFLLVIMGIGQLVNISTGTISTLYIMTVNSEHYRNITAVINLFGLVSTPVLIYLWGEVGAAISYSAIMAVNNLFLVTYFKFKVLSNERFEHY